MYPRVNRNRQNIKPKQGQKDLSDDIRNEEINTGAGNEAALLGNIGRPVRQDRKPGPDRHGRSAGNG